MNSEKNILNENIVKSKFEKKMNEYSLKNVNQGCLEMLNIGFNTFIKNLLNNLEKVAAIEKNSESLNGFLKNTENIVLKLILVFLLIIMFIAATHENN